jgi:hypothetical protein
MTQEIIADHTAPTLEEEAFVTLGLRPFKFGHFEYLPDELDHR